MFLFLYIKVLPRTGHLGFFSTKVSSFWCSPTNLEYPDSIPADSRANTLKQLQSLELYTWRWNGNECVGCFPAPELVHWHCRAVRVKMSAPEQLMRCHETWWGLGEMLCIRRACAGLPLSARQDSMPAVFCTGLKAKGHHTKSPPPPE